MKAHSSFGGRHELGQNYLVHRPTIHITIDLVRATEGDILEIGAGGGALTLQLAGLGRDLLAIDIDPDAVERLQQRLQQRVHERLTRQMQRTVPAAVVHADARTVPFNRPVIVGNIPYHLTTPVLRRLLTWPRWQDAVLLTQWEVARKRAGVGGGTMLTAQTAPWFQFELRGRVPASGFRPRPGVDGGVLTVRRRAVPLLEPGATSAEMRCSGCQGPRPSRLRPTAAAIAIQGSRGATGASEPSRSSAPAPCSEARADARPVRSAQ